MEDLKHFLATVPNKDRQGLKAILGSNSVRPKDIVKSLWWNCQSIFGYTFGNEPSYKSLLLQVSTKLDLNLSEKLDEKVLEVRIAQKVMKTVWDKMTDEQKKEFESKLRDAASEYDKGGALVGSASMFGALTAAQLSGFGVYLLASTTLGAITGAVGVALPFAVYTSMSSAIAVIIGPVGWIGAGLFAIWKLTGANYKKLVPAIIYISALRAKLGGGFD